MMRLFVPASPALLRKARRGEWASRTVPRNQGLGWPFLWVQSCLRTYRVPDPMWSSFGDVSTVWNEEMMFQNDGCDYMMVTTMMRTMSTMGYTEVNEDG